MTDISTFSVMELKAAAYDAFLRIEQEQNNIRVINEEIEKRIREEKTEKK